MKEKIPVPTPILKELNKRPLTILKVWSHKMVVSYKGIGVEVGRTCG